jgi:antitoxin component YwqK of YwqJK toxin-antitoxin module
MKLLLMMMFVGMISCDSRELSAIEVIRFDPAVIDSIKRIADPSYSELIGRSDFFTVEYYITREDSSQTKILKDSIGHVVGMSQIKNRAWIFGAEYYSNGQIKGTVSYTSAVADRPAKYYYPDGRIRSMGNWKNDSQVGIWKEYSENGALKEIINYDDSGTVINKKEFSN